MPRSLDTSQSPVSPDPISKDDHGLAKLGAELLRRAEESQPGLEAAWDQLMANLGIRGELIEIQRLREMIQQESGDKAEDSTFSRELIANREGRSL